MLKVEKTVASKSIETEQAMEVKDFGLAPRELLIDKLGGFSVMSFEQLLYIGKGNLTYLKDRW